MRPVRVAVVGCGYWAPNIVRNLSNLRQAEVVALCDVDTRRAQEIASRFAPGATVHRDHHELCRDPRVDAVFLATPVRSHFPLARDFLAAGKHTFVEKPLAMTVAECEELRDLADVQGMVLMVGHVFEFNAAVAWVKQYLASGELGRLLYVHSQRLNLGRIQSDINALWSFAPHDISIVNYWLGAEPIAVSARGLRCLNHGVDDVVFVLLRYPDNVSVHLHLAWIAPKKIREMTLVGTKKMLVYDDVSIDTRIQVFDKGVKNLHEYMTSPDSFAEFQYQIRLGDVLIPNVKFGEPLQDECQHFVQSINTGTRPLTDADNGLRVVRALQAAQESMERGGIEVPVAVPSPAIPALASA